MSSPFTTLSALSSTSCGSTSSSMCSSSSTTKKLEQSRPGSVIPICTCKKSVPQRRYSDGDQLVQKVQTAYTQNMEETGKYGFEIQLDQDVMQAKMLWRFSPRTPIPSPSGDDCKSSDLKDAGVDELQKTKDIEETVESLTTFIAPYGSSPKTPPTTARSSIKSAPGEGDSVLEKPLFLLTTVTPIRLSTQFKELGPSDLPHVSSQDSSPT